MDNQPQYQPKRKLKCPLTPYQLFSPVSTVFLDNMTAEEQVLGLYKQFNDFINSWNALVETINSLAALPDQMKELQDAMTLLQNTVTEKLLALAQAVSAGDKATLEAANKYTDEQIAKIPPSTGGGECCLGITAGEYDSIGIGAVYYDNLQITAKEYDNRGRIIFFGDMSTIYLQYDSNIIASALETVFDLGNPPVKIGRVYQFEISLGTFSLDSGSPAHLEIVGQNTKGNTLPITIPSGGSATVAGIFNEVPTSVRLMSGEDQISAHNAYIKIKPLGEAHYGS